MTSDDKLKGLIAFVFGTAQSAQRLRYTLGATDIAVRTQRKQRFFRQGVHNVFGVQPASYLRVPQVKEPRREADRSTPYSELQNKWSYTSLSPMSS
jgi:hypothetical protein